MVSATLQIGACLHVCGGKKKRLWNKEGRLTSPRPQDTCVRDTGAGRAVALITGSELFFFNFSPSLDFSHRLVTAAVASTLKARS